MLGISILIICTLVLIACVCILVFVLQERARIEKYMELTTKNAENKSSGSLRIISGSPIDDGADVRIFCGITKLTLVGAHRKFELPYSRVHDIQCIEMNTSAVSESESGKDDADKDTPADNLSDDTAGIIVFGTLGIPIGTIRNGSTYFVIIYKDTNDSDTDGGNKNKSTTKRIVIDGNGNRKLCRKIANGFARERVPKISR